MAVYMLVSAQIPDLTDPALIEYSKQVAECVAKHGGTFCIRGGPVEMFEGEWPSRGRVVVHKWPSIEAARAFWDSDEYQNAIKPIRKGTGIYDVAIFEALDE